MFARDRYESRTAHDPVMLVRHEPVVYPRGRESFYPSLSASQRDAYQQNGFLLMPALFTSDEVAGLYDGMQSMRAEYALSGRDEVIAEPGSGEVRSIFNVHRLDRLFGNLVRDPRVLNIARDILGGDVYIHQSRINYKPGFKGKEFYWHSDFETWHSEDGMPAMRALSCSVLLTDNNEFNGPLMVIPGSHRHFISCTGETPDDHYKMSLKKQEYGVPDEALLSRLNEMGGIVSCKGEAGTAIFFDCNTMHASNSNISPYPRSNVFFVYNSMDNQLGAPKGGLKPRPEFVAGRDGIAALAPAPLSLTRS